jgi:tetrahydromethanopterin:alpha-L-glutamate ligase
VAPNRRVKEPSHASDDSLTPIGDAAVMSPLLIAGSLTPPNVGLLSAARGLGVQARLLPPETAEKRARLDEIVLGRVDVLAGLDGVEPGLESLRRLEAAGLCVLNRADAVLAAHDKLETARRLHEAGLPHPSTIHVRPGDDLPGFDRPVVLKPRFGSWGTDVVRCRSDAELEQAFTELSRRHWFQTHGVLVQDLIVPPPVADLRVLVAGGTVAGAISRHAAPGEWRTNVALGGTRWPAIPSADARDLAVAAAAAIDADLVGVDLLPTDHGYTILELNGCVDFNADYSLPGREVFEAAIEPLVLPFVVELERLAERREDELPLFR